MIITNEQLQTLKDHARNNEQNRASMWLYVAEIIGLDEEAAAFGAIQELRSIKDGEQKAIIMYDELISFEIYRKIEKMHGKDVLSKIQQAIKHDKK